MEEPNDADNNFILENNNENNENNENNVNNKDMNNNNMNNNDINGNNNPINIENKIDRKMALDNLMKRNEGYKHIYDILNGNIQTKERKNKKKKQTFKTSRTEYDIGISNLDMLRRNNKSKLYDYKIEMLYGKILSLQKESARRPNSISKYPEKIKNYDYNQNMNKIKKGKTPFQIYYNEFQNQVNEVPLKLSKNTFRKNVFYPIENKRKYNNYKNVVTYPDDLGSFEHIDKWIDKEKRIQRNNFYSDKKSEISNLLSFTRNNDNKNKNFKLPIFHSFEGNQKNINYYSGDFFKNELNKFSSLLRSSDYDKKSKKKI